MALHRALAGSTCVCLALLTGCAHTTAPALAPAQRCIDAAYRKGVPRGYTIAGRPSSRDEIERTVFTTREEQARARRYPQVSTGSFWMLTGGGAGTVGGGLTALLTHHPALLVISGAGAVTAITGIILGVTNEDPLPAAINAFNVKALEDGRCDERPFPVAPPLP